MVHKRTMRVCGVSFTLRSGIDGNFCGTLHTFCLGIWVEGPISQRFEPLLAEPRSTVDPHVNTRYEQVLAADSGTEPVKNSASTALFTHGLSP